MRTLSEVCGPHSTVDTAIRTFCATFFDQPRNPCNISTGQKPLTATFQAVGGIRTYHIEPTEPDAQLAYRIMVDD